LKEKKKMEKKINNKKITKKEKEENTLQ